MLAVPWGARSLLRAPEWALRARGSGFKGAPAQQVAVITRANRTQLLGGKYYRYMAEPVVRALARNGVTAATWEFDRPARRPGNCPAGLDGYAMSRPGSTKSLRGIAKSSVAPSIGIH
jgi:hypothetical protein